MKINIILDEEKYAKNIINTRDIGDKPSTSLNILAKYYKQVERLSGKKLYNKLDGFMASNYPNYNPVQWSITLDKYIKQSNKYPLVKIKYIPITQKEINAIQTLKSVRAERIVFSLLCFAKFFNAKNEKNNSWTNVKIRDVCGVARVAITTKERDRLIYTIGQSGLIEFSNRSGNTNIRVNFVDDEGEPVLKITDFRELGYEYMLYKGGNYFRCKHCDILVKQNKNGTRKYCKDCIGYQPIQKKTIVCCDCGKEFEVDARNMTKTRCDDCYKEYRKQKVKENVQRYRENREM